MSTSSCPSLFPCFDRSAAATSGVEERVCSEERINCSKDLVFRIFVVVSIFLASLLAVVGVLALMATQEALPSSLTSIVKLAVIGEANSAVMIAGGCALFGFAIFAWKCYEDNLKKSD